MRFSLESRLQAVFGPANRLKAGLQRGQEISRQHLLDRGVLGGGKRLAADLAASKPATLFKQGLRTKQAADVLGSERWVELG